MENKNILITGATSFLALNLINKLIDKNYIVYAVVRPASRNLYKLPKLENIKVIEMDMHEFDKILLKKLPLMYGCFHFAWEGIRGKERNDVKLQLKNYKMSCMCIDVARKMGVKKFIGIGSWAEYKETEKVISEESILAPSTKYGKMKLKTCKYGMDSLKNEKMIFVWTRLFSAYGVGEYENTLINMCIHKMIKNEEICLSPCEHLWNYIYVDDISELYLLMLERCQISEIYNIASNDTRKLKDFIIQIANILNTKSKLNFGAMPYGNKVPCGMAPSIDKCLKELGWLPQVSFEKGIIKMIEEIKNEKN